jgi:hypothetical protein
MYGEEKTADTGTIGEKEVCMSGEGYTERDGRINSGCAQCERED